jgi:IS30 family transposase
LNENSNGLLRQYWHKGKDFKIVTTNDVDPVILQLNHRPQKVLGYDTPSELMAEHITAIAA